MFAGTMEDDEVLDDELSDELGGSEEEELDSEIGEGDEE